MGTVPTANPSYHSASRLQWYIADHAATHCTKPASKCSLVYYNGETHPTKACDIPSRLMFKVHPGDNSAGYAAFNDELYNNIIVYNIAKKEKLLRATPFPNCGAAYVNVVYDKVYTPFDNCIDLRLILTKALLPPGTAPTHKDLRGCRRLLGALHDHGYTLAPPLPPIVKTLSGQCVFEHFGTLQEADEDSQASSRIELSLLCAGSPPPPPRPLDRLLSLLRRLLS